MIKTHSQQIFKHRQKFPYQKNFISPPFQKSNNPKNTIWIETKLCSGIWISFMDITPENNVILKYEKEKPLIDFGFVLNGSITNKVKSLFINKMEINNKTGQSGVTFLPKSEGIVEIPGKKRLQIFHIHITPNLLNFFLNNELDILPYDLKTVVEGSIQKGYLYQGEMDPALQTSVHQIFYHFYTGEDNNLFFEGKALEILSLQISGLDSKKRIKNQISSISPNEKNRIYAAREILIKNITSPPTLAELSHNLSISINKLEAGFHKFFGMSVFAFLKEYKMQKARLFFEEADMNVSEVAWTVGYVNVSHFSQAFKKRFGILPKNYLKSVRNKKIKI